MMNVNHTTVKNLESGRKFLELLQTLLHSLRQSYPECKNTVSYVARLEDGLKMASFDKVAEFAASKWNHEFSKICGCGKSGYELSDRQLYRELLGAGVKPLVELDILEKWHDPLTTEDTRNVLTWYVQNLNKLVRTSLEIPIPNYPSLAPVSTSSTSYDTNSNIKTPSSSNAEFSLRDMMPAGTLDGLTPSVLSKLEASIQKLSAGNIDLNNPTSFFQIMESLQHELTEEDCSNLEQQSGKLMMNPEISQIMQNVTCIANDTAHSSAQTNVANSNMFQ